MFALDVSTKIFVAAVRDKIFDIGIVAALGHELGDTDFNVRSSAINFFTAVTAQGALPTFRGIFIPKYWQRDSGTRYLTLRLLPHLDVH